MLQVNLLGGLVRGADGVLYRVSTGTCEPLSDTLDDIPVAGAGLTRRGPDGSSEYVAARTHMDPSDHAAARQHIDPGDHAAARQHIDPGDRVAGGT